MSRRARPVIIPAETSGNAAVSLAELETGRSARVLEVRGDALLAGRMEAMGIVPGSVIMKKSAIPSHGPIVVAKGPVQLAISHDMGRSVLVEPDKQRP